MSEKKHKMFLITTKGCEGCKIQQRILSELFDEFKNQYDFEVMSYKKFHDKYESDINAFVTIDDFPTTLFLIDDRIFYNVVGTRTKKRLKDYIKTWLDTKEVFVGSYM